MITLRHWKIEIFFREMEFYLIKNFPIEVIGDVVAHRAVYLCKLVIPGGRWRKVSKKCSKIIFKNNLKLVQALLIELIITFSKKVSMIHEKRLIKL